MMCGSSIALVATLGLAPCVSAQGVNPAQGADPARTPDAAFVAKAAEVASVDTGLASLAATRATAADVKALARRVLDARSVITRDLETMAGTRQLATTPRPAADPPTPASVSALRAQPPGAFDAAFLAALLANGEAAIALFEAESRDGRDDEIKEWAARQLPALREHLTAIRTLRPRPGS